MSSHIPREGRSCPFQTTEATSSNQRRDQDYSSHRPTFASPDSASAYPRTVPSSTSRTKSRTALQRHRRALRQDRALHTARQSNNEQHRSSTSHPDGSSKNP